MKLLKGAAAIGLCSLLTIGCGQNMANDAKPNEPGIYSVPGENKRSLHTNNHDPQFYNPEVKATEAGFGYVRHKRSGVMNAEEQPQYTINRELVANIVSRLGTQVPNVDDVSTLVTDEEVLIVYETDNKDREATAEQVKKMAMSVVPAWFHIHVSDDPGLRQNIENFATLNTNTRDINRLLDDVIEKMNKSPQGTEQMNEQMSH